MILVLLRIGESPPDSAALGTALCDNKRASKLWASRRRNNSLLVAAHVRKGSQPSPPLNKTQKDLSITCLEDCILHHNKISGCKNILFLIIWQYFWGHRFSFQENGTDSKNWPKLGLNIARCREVLGSVENSENLGINQVLL